MTLVTDNNTLNIVHLDLPEEPGQVSKLPQAYSGDGRMASIQSETMKDYNNKPMSELVKKQAFIITGGMGGGSRGGGAYFPLF